MKINQFCLILCLFLFIACSEQPLPLANPEVEVIFRAQQPTVTRNADENNLPSILVFKENAATDLFSYVRNEDASGWEPMKDSDQLFQKSILLPIGNYRFLMARGFTENTESTDQPIFASEPGAVGLNGRYDRDYYLRYPSVASGGELELRTCTTELFVDANGDGGFEPNDKVYNLIDGNKFSVKRKVIRLQARLDWIVRRGTRSEGIMKPLPEGVGNVDALANALQKIDSIKVTASGVSSRCQINGLTFSTPGKYCFTMKKQGAAYGFVPFDSQLFASEFTQSEQTEIDYKHFEKSAYCKGPLLFPAPEGAEVDVHFEIYYKKPLKTRRFTEKILLERNKVSLITLWLLNEEIGTDVEIMDNLEYGEAKGDDGFWN